MVPGSSIVIITSTEAYRGSYGASAYAATKAAIHNLVRTLANNLGQRGIRINALPAGWIGEKWIPMKYLTNPEVLHL